MHSNIGIIGKNECVGCGACAWVCPKGCISLHTDEEGFLYPKVHEDNCAFCGECVEVCKKHIEIQCENKLYMAINRDDNIRKRSSSGGVFFEIAKEVLKGNGIVYGAVFANDFSVKHERAENENELYGMLGSKYAQSDMSKVFAMLSNDLENQKTVLFSGTPCQVTKVRNVFSGYREQLICVEVVCHGVPSPGVWKKYLKFLCGQEKIVNVSFRDKSTGWENYSLTVSYEKSEYKKQFIEEMFMKGFLDDLFLRTSCYRCKDKIISGADITIGDFWGINDLDLGLNAEGGISAVILHSFAGERLWKKIENRMNSQSIDYVEFLKRNPYAKKSANLSERRKAFFDDMKRDVPIDLAINNNLRDKRTIDNIGFHLFDKWMTCLKTGKAIERFFIDNNYCKVAIYGMGIIGRHLLDELITSSISVDFVIDKNADNISIESVQMITPDRISEMSIVDVIVITPVQFYCDIERMIIESGFEGDIASVEQVIDYAFNDK